MTGKIKESIIPYIIDDEFEHYESVIITLKENDCPELQPEKYCIEYEWQGNDGQTDFFSDNEYFNTISQALEGFNSGIEYINDRAIGAAAIHFKNR